MKKKWTSLLLIFICLTTAMVAQPGLAGAGELEDRQEQLDRVNKEIERYKQSITAKQGQERSLLSELKKLEQTLNQGQKDLKYLETRLESTQRGLIETQAALEETQKEISKRNDLLNNRLKWLYRVGPTGYMEVLLGSTTIQDLLSRFQMVQSVVKYDVSLVTGLRADEQAYADQKAVLEQRRTELNALKVQVALKQEQVDQKQAEREQFLAKVTKERTEYEKALDELEELSDQLISIIRDLQAEQSYKAGGPLSMIWPAKGAITSKFGMRKHPILGKLRMHSGIDIGASMGSSLLAAEAGKVLHSGVLGGYGNAIIIDHGNGVSTLYGHAQVLYVSEGQIVNKGALIGKVGKSGLATGPHLHFEVRVGGAPKNPLSYLK